MFVLSSLSSASEDSMVQKWTQLITMRYEQRVILSLVSSLISSPSLSMWFINMYIYNYNNNNKCILLSTNINDIYKNNVYYCLYNAILCIIKEYKNQYVFVIPPVN